MATVSLVKVFGGSTTYIADTESNFTTIESALNALDASVGTALGGIQDQRVNELYDRNGIFGKASYKPVAATLSGPSYLLTVAAGAYWNGNELRKATGSSTISLLAFSTGTLYVNVPSGGVPTVTDTLTLDTVWQFAWDASTHVVSSVAFYNSTADILLDGDDYAACLSGGGGPFLSLSDRLDAISTGTSYLDGQYAQNTGTTTGLTFGYKEGYVRNDNVISHTAAGTIGLTDNATNYVELNTSTGAITKNTSGYTSGKIPLFTVVTASGSISTVTDHRTWATAGGAGGSHAQNTDLGTDNSSFQVNYGTAGAPSSNGSFGVDRGTSPDVDIRWNETDDVWEFTNDGSTYQTLGSGSGGDLGSQVLSKLVMLANPTMVEERLAIGTDGAYVQNDLGPSGSNTITDAPQGLAGLVLRVQFWDTTPGSTVNVKFKQYGSVSSPAKAYTVWGGSHEYDDVATLILPGDDGNTTPTLGYESLVTASGSGHANVRVFLLGYYVKVTGTGTQKKDFISAGNAVSSSSSQTFNLAAYVNRGLVSKLKITETGGTMTGTYDVEIYSKSTFLAGDLLYKATAIDATLNSRIYTDRLPFMYEDEDATSKLHIKIINNDGSHNGTFTFELVTEQFL